MTTRRWLQIAAMFGLFCMPGSLQAQNVVRIEIHPIETVTLTTNQFLSGNPYGKPAVVAGQLRIPKPGNNKLPAVVLVHGSGGVNASADRWAQDLNSIGIAVFVLDAFSGRGISSTVNDQAQLDTIAMMVDAYRALELLARHSRIDASRIAVMGFSKGGVAAVYSSSDRFRKMYAAAGTEFAAHIGLYTPCNTTYLDDDKTTGKPIRMFHGSSDDWVAIGPCREYVERLKLAGADVTLTEYPGAYHAYDAFLLKEPLSLPQAQTGRNCAAREDRNGVVVNAKTGTPFTFPDDPCVERGVHIAYDAAAYQATVNAVKEFLTSTLKAE
jgi:dienelactone hydrolase